MNAGTLQAGSSGGLSASSDFTVNSTLDLNGFSNAIGSLAGSGIVTNNGLAAATLSAGSDGASTTFSGYAAKWGQHPGADQERQRDLDSFRRQHL